MEPGRCEPPVADEPPDAAEALLSLGPPAVAVNASSAAVATADAASAASPQAGPRMRAFLAGQQAHAYAQIGERGNALLCLREAEVAMDQAESREKPFGSYDPAALNYPISQVRYELGDARGAVAALQQADRLHSNVYRRARVRHRALLAERQLAIGHLEAACATWHQALDDYPMVQSGRADDRITAMFGHLRPYLKNAVARALYERARRTVPSRLLA